MKKTTKKSIILIGLLIVAITSFTILQNYCPCIVLDIKNWIKSQSNIIQTITSVFAIFIAIYAMTKDSIRDNDSSKRYLESLKREQKQHNEIVNVYTEQITLLDKYGKSADSMLEQLKIQSKITELQFESQKILTQPYLNLNFEVHDFLDSSFQFKNEDFIMPEVIFQIHNFGNRIAKDVEIEVKVISLKRRLIHYFKKENISSIYPKATMPRYYFPAIYNLDKDFFIIEINISWKDEFNENKLFEETLIMKFLRETNNSYTTGVVSGELKDILDFITNNAETTLTDERELRDVMFKLYNK